jgi:hypothetical protein
MIVVLSSLLLLGLGTTFAQARSGRATGTGNTPDQCDETTNVDPNPKNDRCPEVPPCDADHGIPASHAKPCQCPDGTTSENGECPPEPCPEGQVADSETGECTEPCPDGSAPAGGQCPPTGSGFCNAFVLHQTILPIPDESGTLFNANPEGSPCEDDAQGISNAAPLLVASAVTDKETTSADANVVGLDGGDQGALFVCGSHADPDGSEGWVLKAESGGETAFKIGGQDGDVPDPGLNSEGAGLFLGESDGDTASCAALRSGPDEDVLVLAQSQAHS